MGTVSYTHLDVYKRQAPENPVIPASLLPEGYDQRNFRDPKVWKDGNLYYVIVGCCAEENGGEAALFSSVDLRNWKFETILDKSYGKLGICLLYTSCPPGKYTSKCRF